MPDQDSGAEMGKVVAAQGVALTALLIDDNADFLAVLTEVVAQEGIEVSVAGSLREARETLARAPVDLVVVDLMLPDGSGIGLLKELRESTRSDVIIVSGVATIDSVVEALRLGALDYLTKPLDLGRLRAVLANVVRVRSLKAEVGTLRGELRKLGRFGRLIGVSPAMQKVYDMISKVSSTDASVFLSGETGTGKELVAQTIFEQSARRHRPFIPLDCGAMPPTLIESALFGHERGSFTGATQMRRGHFERASGGTVFLDEITEMPIELQVKLLRTLESGTLTRVGGDEPIKVNLRVIAATNRTPKDAVADGKLREDLYYRLNVFPIVLPPLRERGEDALLLADRFLDAVNTSQESQRTLSAAARRRLVAYAWPGNVRELRNEVQRAAIMAESVIDFEDLGAESFAQRPSLAANVPSVGSSLDESERALILATLKHCAGDKKRAAEVLGVSLKTLYNRLNHYAST